eukprot:scaffold1299_cov246-Pinguiococcus_pyrenoidosus.AAC.8
MSSWMLLPSSLAACSIRRLLISSCAKERSSNLSLRWNSAATRDQDSFSSRRSFSNEAARDSAATMRFCSSASVSRMDSKCAMASSRFSCATSGTGVSSGAAVTSAVGIKRAAARALSRRTRRSMKAFNVLCCWRSRSAAALKSLMTWTPSCTQSSSASVGAETAGEPTVRVNQETRSCRTCVGLSPLPAVLADESPLDSGRSVLKVLSDPAELTLRREARKRLGGVVRRQALRRQLELALRELGAGNGLSARATLHAAPQMLAFLASVVVAPQLRMPTRPQGPHRRVVHLHWGTSITLGG